MSAPARVEMIARIIDPLAWCDRDNYAQTMNAQGGCDLTTIADVAHQYVRHSLRTAHDILEALPPTIAEENRQALTRIRTSMALLQQNSEGCALNHYGDDASLHGMPGWLADTKADVQRLTEIVESLGASA